MDISFGTQCSDAPSESDVLVFSTQCSADAPSKGEPRRPRMEWSPTEDVVLIKAWLNTSKNPILAHYLKVEAFWERIASHFASSKKLAGLQKRSVNHCKQRWKEIDDMVCKFVGCYMAATRFIHLSTAQTENDVMKLANQLYFNDHKVKFNLEHAWRELRHEPKWCPSSSATGMAKRRKCEEGFVQSSSSHLLLTRGKDDEAMVRPPPGFKPLKPKAKTNVTNTSTVEGEDNSLLEFKRQEKLSKHKLLNTLLTKTEPLCEMEMALKNKLINDMLSS